MLKVTDVEDAILQAKVRFSQSYGEIVKEYMSPYEELAKLMMTKWPSKEMKEELAKRAPDAMSELVRRYGSNGGNNGMGPDIANTTET